MGVRVFLMSIILGTFCGIKTRCSRLILGHLFLNFWSRPVRTPIFIIDSDFWWKIHVVYFGYQRSCRYGTLCLYQSDAINQNT